MLSKEQANQVKKQLIHQIESNFPEDKKEIAIQQVESMSNEQLEEFLKQNKLIKNQQGEPQQCIFCSIINGKIPSYKIDENEKGIAILEIKPISYGHTIIIPKEHIKSEKELPKEAIELTQKVAKKIKEKLNPKEVSISPINILGHEAINVLPIYENENMNSPRKQIQPEELEELQNKLLKKKKEIKEEPKKEIENINEKNTWLPKRIP